MICVRWLAVAGMLGALGCSTPRGQYRIEMSAKSDDGQTLQGVTVYHQGEPLGATGPSGTLAVTVEADEGSVFEVAFDCPEGLHPIRESVEVPLRRARNPGEDHGDPGRSSYALSLECRPETRNAILVIRTNIENLPIEVDGEPIAHTNGYGVAHATLALLPEERFEVSLRGDETVRPRDKSFSFVVPDKNEVFVVQQSFKPAAVEPAPRPKRRRRPRRAARRQKKKKERSGPTRLTGHEEFGSVGRPWKDVP